tara:strand:- start:654 stop:839 length:186 start_codon:yes stop_codon:yes gene_type:complete
MTYKVICGNCVGNGYLTIQDNKGETEIKQCWTCESEGEVKLYDQHEVDDIIYNTCSRKRLQ